MSGPTPFDATGTPLFTEQSPGIVQLADLMDYINEMRDIYNEIKSIENDFVDSIKFLNGRKLVDASQFPTLQQAIDFSTSIGAVVYVDQVNEPSSRINLTCSIVGNFAKSKVSVYSITIPRDTVNLIMKDFELTTDYSLSVNVSRNCKNIYFEKIKFIVGSNFETLNPQKRLAIIASGIDPSTPIENIKIKECEFVVGGIQLALCSYWISDNKMDGQWLNLDEHIHVSYKSRGFIKNNVLLNSLQDGIDIYSSGDKSIIVDNKIDGITLQGIEAKVSLSDDQNNSSGNDLGYVESTIICNNIIRDIRGIVNASGVYLGINVSYYDNRSSKIYDPSKLPNNLIITSNLIEDFYMVPYTNGTPIFQGILFNGSNAVIKNNIIRNLKTRNTGATEWRNAGIILQTNSGSQNTNLNISGNIINTDHTGIYVYHLSKSIVSNNLIGGDNKNGLLPRYGILNDPTTGIIEDCSILNNQITCKTSYNDSNNVSQPIVGLAIDSRGSTVFKDNLVSGNKTFNGSFSLYTATFTTITQNNIKPKTNNPAFEMISSVYRYGNKIINNTLHSDGTNTGIVVQYQKAMVCNDNTVDKFNTAIQLAGYVDGCVVKNNFQLYDTGDAINATLVKVGATGINAPTFVQSDNFQIAK